MAERRERSIDETGVAGGAGANNCVETVSDDVDEPVAVVQVEFDLWVMPCELSQ